jgi:hypothetical protein
MPTHDASTTQSMLARRLVVPTLIGFVFYFGLWLVPEWWPAIRGTAFFFFYVLSMPITLLALLCVGLWGTGGILLSKRRGHLVASKHQALLAIALAGLGLCVTTALLSRSIRGALPTGSHLLEFDSVLWQSPGSENFVRGDITPRQKMLGSILEQLGEGVSRSEIERFLGPSLETQYFSNSERDLIYVLGPERDALFGLDSEWLLIWLDDSDKLERYEVWRD